jgi:hypothetical protein
MDVSVINASIQRAVADNRRAEMLLIAMAVAQFILGLLVILVGCWIRSRYVMASGTLPLGLLTFPIAEIRKLRLDNIVLRTIPTIIGTLPPRDAIAETKKLLQYLRGSRR